MSAKELELKDVKTREYSDDLVCFCPGRPELPEWSVGGNS